MTAHAMAGDREKCLAHDMNDHVPKPTEPDNLYQVLLRWVEPQPSHDVIQPQLNDTDQVMDDGDLLPEQLHGFDLAGGLRRAGGNRSLLHKLLIEFRDDYQAGLEKLAIYCENGAFQEAHRLVHTIKGAAGNLGADALYAAASDLDDGLKNQAVDAKALQRFHQVMADTMESLSILEKAPSARQKHLSEQTADNERLVPLLKELETLLAQGNAKASLRLEEIYLVAGSSHARQLADIADKIDDFEFEEAAEILKPLIKNLEEI